jgi:hypothetical protein
MTGRELAEKLYREGKLASLATLRPLTQEEQQERERLARLFASDKLASEMVLEDRGTNQRLAFFGLSCYTTEEVLEGDSQPTWN